MKTAKLVRCNVVPMLFDWTREGAYIFLGSLDGDELWISPQGEYVRQFGPREQDHGSLGSMAPTGTPYGLAGRLAARPTRTINAYRTA